MSAMPALPGLPALLALPGSTFGTVRNVRHGLEYHISYCGVISPSQCVVSIAGETLCKQFWNSFAYQIAFYKNNNDLLFFLIVVLLAVLDKSTQIFHGQVPCDGSSD